MWAPKIAKLVYKCNNSGLWFIILYDSIFQMSIYRQNGGYTPTSFCLQPPALFSPQDSYTLEKLLQAPRHPGPLDETGYTALHEAARCGQLEALQLLLEARAEVDGRGSALIKRHFFRKKPVENEKIIGKSWENTLGFDVCWFVNTFKAH